MLQSKVATNQGCESRGLALPVRVCNTHKHAKPDSTRASGGGVWCQLKPSFAPVTNSPQSQGLALPEVSSHSCRMSADPRRPTSWNRPIRNTAGHPGGSPPGHEVLQLQRAPSLLSSELIGQSGAQCPTSRPHPRGHVVSFLLRFLSHGPTRGIFQKAGGGPFRD